MIICYYDPDITKTPDMALRWADTDIKTFRKTYPNAVIRHIFLTKQDQREKLMDPVKFAALTPTIGMNSNDFGRIIQLSNHTYCIVGIAPKNRKYKVLIQDIETENIYKASVTSVNNAIEEKMNNRK